MRPLQIGADFETAHFELCAYLTDFYVGLKFILAPPISFQNP